MARDLLIESARDIERLRAALVLAAPALTSYDGYHTVSCNVCDLDLPDPVAAVCGHGDRCPVVLAEGLLLAARKGAPNGTDD